MKKYSSTAVWTVCAIMLFLAAVMMWETGKPSTDIPFNRCV